MSIRANPTAIGLFMIGGLILTVVGVATLASTAWFGRQSTFISYFDESVNGLEIGAPVKFQGVPIGQVTNLLIQIESRDKTFQVPVEYRIDLARLTSQTGSFLDLEDPNVLRQQIADGLRAQLQMESLVTGQLYIELSYNPEAAVAQLATRPTAHPEIPTTQSLLAAFGTQAGSVVGEVMGILIRVNEMLEAVNMEELNRSVVASAAAVERLADSPEVLAAIQGIPEVTSSTGLAMAEIRRLSERLGATVDPLQVQVATTNAEMVLTLQSIREGIEETRGMLTPDSGLGYRMDGTMASLESAADALRALATSLERNPDMLLRGRRSEAN